MSKPKDSDDSKKAQAATNLAFTDDENLTQEDAQIQNRPSEQQKDALPVPEHDPLDDSGVFSPQSSNPPGATAAQETSPSKPPAEEKSPSSKRLSRRSPSMDTLKAGAEALYKNVKEAVKTVLRSSSSSPKKGSEAKKGGDRGRLQVKEEVKKKRNPSMVSMASISTDTDPELDSGVTEVSNLPESDTFDRSVAPLPMDESIDNLAQGVDRLETDNPGEVETEDLPEADKYKVSDDKKNDGKKDADKKPGGN